jgi:hypothetical protein
VGAESLDREERDITVKPTVHLQRTGNGEFSVTLQDSHGQHSTQALLPHVTGSDHGLLDDASGVVEVKTVAKKKKFATQTKRYLGPVWDLNPGPPACTLSTRTQSGDHSY